MDPFVEKDLIENLRSIALSLRNIDRKMDDMAMSIRELAATEQDEDDIDNSEDVGVEI
ncbi:MAG: hypothetical protein Q8L27_03165 [archaeon]|nr:hypothetical protein [archaeon]